MTGRTPHVTTLLLARAQDDDEQAASELLTRLMPRIAHWVRTRRGARLRAYEETLDSAQDVALQLFRYLPKVAIDDGDALERLLLRMIQNSLSNRSDYLNAQRRALTRQQPLHSDVSLTLDPPDPSTPSPSAAAIEHEREAWLRLALALLANDDQELIFRRFYAEESYAVIGERLGIDADAARMRCNRAQARLASAARKLRNGQARELAES